MVYATWTVNGYTNGGVYHDWDSLHRDTFSPLIDDFEAVRFTTHGKTYEERKESVRYVAVTFSNMEPILSWAEIAEIGSWFQTMGKRYGLLTEFRENGIV